MANIVSYGNDALTAAQNRKLNAENFNPVINGRLMRAPVRTIYVFSVARKAFNVSTLLFKKLKLAGCENGERYVRCTSLPDPFPQVCPDNDRGGSRVDDNDAWIAVIDMLNPGNFTLNPYHGDSNPNFYANTNGTNLIAEGVFPSLNEVPTEAEIKKAEDARDKHYRYLTKEALRLFAIGAKQGNEFLQRYPDVHIAMDVLRLKAPWHQDNRVEEECPNCGDSIKPGLAFHKSSVTDKLCVIDPVKALKAKAITREEFEELTQYEEATEVRRKPGRPRNSERVSETVVD
jgi:hypothetical protein